jgi:tetratricopeptide (TPR) repeat protein
MHYHNDKSNRRLPSCRFRAALLALAVTVVFAPAARSGLPVQPDPFVEARIDSLVRAAVDHAYNGRLDLGLKTVDLAETVAANDPRIGLTRYRLLRENYPVSVYQKERARAQAPALLGALARTIAFCDSVLAEDETNATAYLYRGWAYINKAQTDLVARHMRAAASASRHGKSDFDKFYELHPEGDPDAATVLGSYLFFADTLPGFFKFIRWLIRVPGGDRVRGIALVRQGAAGDGYTSQDARMILGVIYYLFDGNLEQAGPILTKERNRHPDYPWLVEYTSSMSFVNPAMAEASERAVSRVLDGWGSTTRGWDGAIQCRLEWRRARLLGQLGDHDRSLAKMAEIVDERPSRAPWILPIVRTAAMETAGRMGLSKDVERWCAEQPEERKKKHDTRHIRRGDKGPVCPLISDPAGISEFVGLGRVRGALYSGRIGEARELNSAIVSSYGESLESRYLEGEIACNEGQHAEAIEIFESLQDDAEEVYRSSPVGNTWVRDLRVQTLLQLGELYIQDGDIEFAHKSYNRARETEPEITLYANLIRGRLRHLERILDTR